MSRTYRITVQTDRRKGGREGGICAVQLTLKTLILHKTQYKSQSMCTMHTLHNNIISHEMNDVMQYITQYITDNYEMQDYKFKTINLLPDSLGVCVCVVVMRIRF